MLAVNGVRVVTLKAAIGTTEAHFLRLEDSLHQPKEQGNPEHHVDHGHPLASDAFEGDVAKARRIKGDDY